MDEGGGEECMPTRCQRVRVAMPRSRPAKPRALLPLSENAIRVSNVRAHVTQQAWGGQCALRSWLVAVHQTTRALGGIRTAISGAQHACVRCGVCYGEPLPPHRQPAAVCAVHGARWICDCIAAAMPQAAGSSSSLCAGRASRRPSLTSRRLPSAAWCGDVLLKSLELGPSSIVTVCNVQTEV